MNYSKNYFGKNLTELSYTDIENFFIEEKKESNSLEFKSYSTENGNLNKSIESITKGICAFLNSEGGILIWGAPKGIKRENRQEKVFIGDLSPVPELKEKDWLINKISDSITPLPIGVNVQTLDKNDSYVYVFEIQQSKYCPHQFKNTYYARLDGQTKPAPHYLIEALFKKITFPQIEGFIGLDKIYCNETNYYLDLTIYIFNFSELQNEENISFLITCPQGVFVKSQIPNQDMYSHYGHQLNYEDFMKVLHFGMIGRYEEKLSFNIKELSTKHQNKVELFFSFGGRYSPLKASDYKLNFTQIDWNNQDNLNYLIEESNENIFLSERQKQSNNTREEILKKILKR